MSISVLIRYLSRQWKIRSIKGTINQPFKIATLLTEMNFPARLNGVQLRDSFEQVLDDLQRDEVISNWSYTEAIEEARIGKRGWVQNYWSQISIIITPPSTVVLENKKKITLPNAPVETNVSTNKIAEPEYTEVLIEKEEVSLKCQKRYKSLPLK